MNEPRTPAGHLTAALLVVVLSGAGVASAGEPSLSLCRLVLQEEEIELQDAELELELARSGLAAYEEIFILIAELWEGDAVERMVYLGSRHDRDSARFSLESAALLVERQRALIEQYRLLCEPPSGEESPPDRQADLDRAFARYLEADCGARARAVEAARVSLEFQRQWLESILELRAGEVATHTQVILARLAVAQEEQRLRDAERRLAACRPPAKEES